MGSTEGTVALVVGIAVVLFVPVLVWATVIAGLVQIVRDKVRESQPAQNKPTQEAQQPIGSK
jgi:Na+-transporting methylmalonyl-CoA/oxaloacetate decarboxylase gamma subunit